MGFYYNGRAGTCVALYPQTAFGYVQDTLSRRGERLEYNAKDVWAQMYSAGYLTRIQNGKRRRYDPKTKNPLTSKSERVLNVNAVALLGEPHDAFSDANENEVEASFGVEHDPNSHLLVSKYGLSEERARHYQSQVDAFIAEIGSFDWHEGYHTYVAWATQKELTSMPAPFFDDILEATLPAGDTYVNGHEVADPLNR